MLNDGFYGEWVQVDGRGRDRVACPRRWSASSTTTAALSGEHPDWDDYRAAMERDRRVLVRIAVERAGPTAAGSGERACVTG